MLIRDRVLELLEEGDATVTELANRLGALTNTVSKAAARLREDGDAHIAAYVRQAALYRCGPGAHTRPAAPDPGAPAEERHDANNLRDVPKPLYFEFDGGLLPGVRHFPCDRLRATMSVSSCGARWEKANGTDADADRFHTCRRCSIGAAHAGRVDHNPSPFKGMTICGRCHRGATRLIGKHLCVSCYNRKRELLVGKNGKGTAPVRLAKLDRRSIAYRAGGVVKTRVFEESVDMTELVVAVLRDEKHAPQFAWRAPASMDWLRDDDVYDRSIGETVKVAGVAAVADSVQDAQEQAVVPIAASPVAGSEVDRLQALRDAVEQLERDAPAQTASSKRVAKKLHQHARRQVRVSNVTINLLRSVGALAPPSAAVSLVPAPASYSAALFSV